MYKCRYSIHATFWASLASWPSPSCTTKACGTTHSQVRHSGWGSRLPSRCIHTVSFCYNQPLFAYLQDLHSVAASSGGTTTQNVLMGLQCRLEQFLDCPCCCALSGRLSVLAMPHFSVLHMLPGLLSCLRVILAFLHQKGID